MACEVFFPPLLPQEALLQKTTAIRYLHQLCIHSTINYYSGALIVLYAYYAYYYKVTYDIK